MKTMVAEGWAWVKEHAVLTSIAVSLGLGWVSGPFLDRFFLPLVLELLQARKPTLLLLLASGWLSWGMVSVFHQIRLVDLDRSEEKARHRGREVDSLRRKLQVCERGAAEDKKKHEAAIAERAQHHVRDNLALRQILAEREEASEEELRKRDAVIQRLSKEKRSGRKKEFEASDPSRSTGFQTPEPKSEPHPGEADEE